MRGNTALGEQMKEHYHLLVIHIFLKDWLKLNYPDLAHKKYPIRITGIKWENSEYWFKLVTADVHIKKGKDGIMLTGFVSFLVNYNPDMMKIKTED